MHDPPENTITVYFWKALENIEQCIKFNIATKFGVDRLNCFIKSLKLYLVLRICKFAECLN
ncbi:MAG: hypothetical protein CFE49_01705 [Pseudomonas sp. PGPPP3]|nr:MAG: hypothetical protein CFE49_01705 [Pseudomonas sp. PGPPP3]